MDLAKVLTRTLQYRAIVTGSLISGFVLVALGLVVGLSGSIGALFSDPTSPGQAIEVTSPVITVILLLLGIAVWQFGRTFALLYTVPVAAGEEAARQFDRQTLKSDILQGLDGRLTDLEEDIAETRRSVQELKREEHAASFDEGTALETGAGDEPSALESGSSTDGAAGRRPLDREGSRTNQGTTSSSRSESGSQTATGGSDPTGSGSTHSSDRERDESGTNQGSDPLP
ncbi:hypothetical protein [Natronosalvus rutilus]|uniref:Uncharacterized protein n=1 Tax=Natronosalvus rutilus TaxID=2953753 RepID=A0A9E7N835_9EURY|nr:hypothetical protein [Natronosalvus rutilus]UTF52133.1 hypothetical protein NGM29_09995 [Natronosalvus rutilus]